MKALMGVESHGERWLVEFGRRSKISRIEWNRLVAEEGLKTLYVSAEFADLLPIVEPMFLYGVRICSQLQTSFLTRRSIAWAKDSLREDAERRARRAGLRVAEVIFVERVLEDTPQTEVSMAAVAR